MSKITLMHNITTFIICLCISMQITSQKNEEIKVDIDSVNTFSVEKSIFSIQLGYFGGWINHEIRLSNKFSLRTEFGTDVRRKWSIDPKWTELEQQASIILEPKFYYNLKKRSLKNKDIVDNAGNYFSIRTAIPVYKSHDDVQYASYFSPFWGMRRNLGKSFNFELNLGYNIYYANQFYSMEAMASVRFGYKF
jgi:hypothetical protein